MSNTEKIAVESLSYEIPKRLITALIIWFFITVIGLAVAVPTVYFHLENDKTEKKLIEIKKDNQIASATAILQSKKLTSDFTKGGARPN